jgi:ATP phosphoribosyltransferase regulatory subunit
MDTSDPDLLPADLLPEGLEDRLPRAAAAATRVMRTIHGVMEGHGYDRVLPPMIEFERSLASRMAGITSRRMFRFVDPQSLRMMALRSDITPQIGRIAGTRLAAAPRPLRLCYAGQVVTIKGDGLDPAREKLQCGAELIGADNVAAAAEVVAVAIEALQAAGAKGVSVDFTLPDLVDTLAAEALPLAPGQIDAVRRELDTKDAGGLVRQGRSLRASALCHRRFRHGDRQAGRDRCRRRARRAHCRAARDRAAPRWPRPPHARSVRTPWL